jgi:Do/DeqQ family serine protease
MVSGFYLLSFGQSGPKFHPMINRFHLVILALIALAPSLAAAQERAVPEDKTQIQLSFAPLVKKTAPAVVNIYTKRTVAQVMGGNPFAGDPLFAPFFRNDVFGGRMKKQVENSLGTGVIVEADGLVVTNAHVVREADEIAVVLSDGREFAATLALKDDASDLALLRFDTKGEKMPFVSLKPSETLEVGDLVLAIGNPFGVGQTVTSGIVSAQGRSSLDINDFNFFIQTDAAINPGNSGGPLVALDGGVVGINSAIYSRDGGSLGIGFAIPSEMVASVIAAEKSGKSGESGVVRPWLGVTAQSVTSEIGASLGLLRPQGALISALHPASPLKKAGIKVSDVVLSVNSHQIKDASEMKFRMATVPLGEKANIKIIRQGKEQTFEVEAIEPPEDPPTEALTLNGKNPFSGATVANINPSIATQLGISDTEQGVVVANVKRGSPASSLLAPGDILLEVNGVKITKTKDVETGLKNEKARGLSLTKNVGGNVQKIVIR